MHPIGGWPSDPGHRALLPFSKPAATQSLPLASTTRGRHSQTDTNTTPPPSSTSIRAVTPAASTTAADGRPRRARARHRRRAQRVESDVDDRPQSARGTPSSARRPDRLAFYMGCCAYRRKVRVSRGKCARAGNQLCVERLPEGAAVSERGWRGGSRCSRLDRPLLFAPSTVVRAVGRSLIRVLGSPVDMQKRAFQREHAVSRCAGSPDRVRLGRRLSAEDTQGVAARASPLPGTG